MQITKADIAKYADFTVNISDTKVDFQIQDAGLMDVAPVIGREHYNAILALSSETAEAIPPVIDYAAFYAALVPFWAMCAYRRLFSVHGVDVTQAGLTTPRDPQYEPVSDKRRGEILGQIRSKVHFYQGELERYIRENNLLEKPDACQEAPIKRNFGFAIAKRR